MTCSQVVELLGSKEQANPTLHYATIHPKKYQQQPQGQEMAYLTNYMKQNNAKRVTVEQLIKSLGTGQNAITCNYEMDHNNNFRFVSSSLILIDVDDDDMETDPMKVLNDLKSTCTGLFYTHSHNVKGSRYRLVFQLDKPVTSERDYKSLVEYLTIKLRELIPAKAIDSIKHPHQIIRGGKSGYEINNYNTFLKLDEWLPKARKMHDDKMKHYASSYDELMENPPTFEQLKEMCEFIGYIPSNDGRLEEWSKVSYAIAKTVLMGIINEQQGYELYHIISGDETKESEWQSFLKNPTSDYRALINMATEKGYKHNRYAYAQNKTVPAIDTEIIHDVERKDNKAYLTKDAMMNALQRNQKLLIDAPTGSGKTTATIKAMKELSESDDIYYLFLTPTKALTEQVAEEHQLPMIQGGVKVVSTIKRSTNFNRNVFVVIYDKVAEVMQALNFISHFKARFRIVIDEAHQLTNAYGYRPIMKDLYSLFDHERVISLIGLSGTVEDVLLTKYNKLLKMKSVNNKSPCTNFNVITYKQLEGMTVQESSDVLVIRTIENMIRLKQEKILVYVNNTKDRLPNLRKKLKDRNIKSVVISSKSKQSSTYRQIIKHETFDDDVQVVLTTSVLAEGINIKNSLNWSCIVVSDASSRLYNTSIVKQISNRFRNQYRHFILFTRIPSEEYPDNKRFYIESDYKFRENTTKNYVDALNDEHAETVSDTFVSTNTEKNHGIYLKGDKITYNEHHLRFQSMQKKEHYYATYRNAFIKEVSRVIGHKVKSILCINDELEKNNADISDLLEQDNKPDNEQLDKIELLNNYQKYFNEHVYNAYLYKDDKPTIKHFEKYVHEIRINAIKNTVKISDYETCYEVCLRISRNAEVKTFYYDIKHLVEVAYFKHIKKATLTKTIYMNVQKATAGKVYTSKELDEEITYLSKRIKFKRKSVRKNDVKGVVKMFQQEKTRNERQRLTELKELTVESVAEKHGITHEQVKNSILLYIKTLPARQQRIMLKAVEKEYGIKV